MRKEAAQKVDEWPHELLRECTIGRGVQEPSEEREKTFPPYGQKGGEG